MNNKEYAAQLLVEAANILNNTMTEGFISNFINSFRNSKDNINDTNKINPTKKTVREQTTLYYLYISDKKPSSIDAINDIKQRQIGIELGQSESDAINKYLRSKYWMSSGTVEIPMVDMNNYVTVCEIMTDGYTVKNIKTMLEQYDISRNKYSVNVKYTSTIKDVITSLGLRVSVLKPDAKGKAIINMLKNKCDKYKPYINFNATEKGISDFISYRYNWVTIAQLGIHEWDLQPYRGSLPYTDEDNEFLLKSEKLSNELVEEVNKTLPSNYRVYSDWDKSEGALILERDG